MTDPIKKPATPAAKSASSKPRVQPPPAASAQPKRARDSFKRSKNADAKFAAAAARAAVETATPLIEAATGGRVSGFSISVRIGDGKASEQANKSK